MAAEEKIPTQEREARVMSGWIMLPITIALYVAGPVLIALAFINGSVDGSGGTDPVWRLLVGGSSRSRVAVLLSPGFFTLQPNEARVLILFGRLQGQLQAGRLLLGQPLLRQRPDRADRRPVDLDAGQEQGRRRRRADAARRSSSATRSACAPAPSTARGSR